MDLGPSIRYLDKMACALFRVVSSGSVGPDAITDKSSPGISDIASVTHCAGQIVSASRPPLTRERCFLTQFISLMLAPLCSSFVFNIFLSSRLMPSAGRVSRAEPPPETRNTTKSSEVRFATSACISRAAAIPASSGMGCDASSTLMDLVGTLCP